MTRLLCDSGPLIATFNKKESQHQRCVRLLAEWPGRLLVPEPVLGETCNFLRNNVPRGAAAEIRFLHAMLDERGDFDIIDPVPEDRRRAVELADRLATAPVGYVDAMVIAIAERLRVPHIATIDYKMVGMMNPVCRLQPLHWVLQES
jgi:predicted nucleic acid-binding protein